MVPRSNATWASTDTACTSKSQKQCDRVPRTRGQSMHLQCYPNHASCISLNELTPGSKLTKVTSRGLDVSLARAGVVHQFSASYLPRQVCCTSSGHASPDSMVSCWSNHYLGIQCGECSVCSPTCCFPPRGQFFVVLGNPGRVAELG